MRGWVVGVVVRFFTTELGDKAKVAEADNQVQVRRPMRAAAAAGPNTWPVCEGGREGVAGRLADLVVNRMWWVVQLVRVLTTAAGQTVHWRSLRGYVMADRAQWEPQQQDPSLATLKVRRHSPSRQPQGQPHPLTPLVAPPPPVLAMAAGGLCAGQADEREPAGARDGRRRLPRGQDRQGTRRAMPLQARRGQQQGCVRPSHSKQAAHTPRGMVG